MIIYCNCIVRVSYKFTGYSSFVLYGQQELLLSVECCLQHFQMHCISFAEQIVALCLLQLFMIALLDFICAHALLCIFINASLRYQAADVYNHGHILLKSALGSLLSFYSHPHIKLRSAVN